MLRMHDEVNGADEEINEELKLSSTQKVILKEIVNKKHNYTKTM